MGVLLTFSVSGESAGVMTVWKAPGKTAGVVMMRRSSGAAAGVVTVHRQSDADELQQVDPFFCGPPPVQIKLFPAAFILQTEVFL